jgi:rfaE bifunctional protein kinase chain/domain
MTTMSLASQIDRFAGKRVLVVGDVMLDELVRGEVSRISPEAPVPVVEVTEERATPGGAANAAANVTSLGGRADLAGVVGDDAAGRTLRDLVAKTGAAVSAIVVDPARPTTRKTRIVARTQQVVRADHESRAPVPAAVTAALIEACVASLAHANACIISDYAKGVVTRELVEALVAAAAPRGIPVIADPKRKDFSVYRGVTLVTPNLLELETAVGHACHGDDEVVRAARELAAALEGGSVLVTRGAAGMTLVESERDPVHTHARARAVFDVTGAGDTVVGTLALALASGASAREAIEIASVAAGIVVSKLGTATTSAAELRDELGTKVLG